MFTLKGHSGLIYGLAFNPNGKRLASAGLDHVNLWDVSAGEELLTLGAGLGGFRSVAFSPDGNQLAAAGTDGFIRIWDATPTLDGHR
jgi:WD40 repeat protein